MPNRSKHPNSPRSLAQIRDTLKQALDERGYDTNAIDVGSSHEYMCTCETCWKWWKACGLGDERNPPFTQAQIDCATYEEAGSGDIHRFRASKMFKVPISEVTDEQRRFAKLTAYDGHKDFDYE